MGRALMHNTTLVDLSLSYNQFSASTAKCVGEGLMINTTLTDLNLNYNQLGSVGGAYLAQALTINTTLTRLELYHCHFCYTGKQFISQSISFNPSITYLFMPCTDNRWHNQRSCTERNIHNKYQRGSTLFDQLWYLMKDRLHDIPLVKFPRDD